MDSRRTFLKRSLALSAAVCTYGLLGSLSACTAARQVSYREQGNDLVIDRAALADVPYALVNHPRLQAPVYLKKTGEGYKALLMLCTHKGCDVSPAGVVLVCPCHGSEFSSSGQVLKGPAVEPLSEFPVRTDDQYIYVQIS